MLGNMKQHTILRVLLERSGAFVAFFGLAAGAFGQKITYEDDPFRQLEEILPSPNEYRAASGAPGHRYWQQRADYRIRVRLDDEKQRINGEETVTYHNRSPLPLSYLWGPAGSEQVPAEIRGPPHHERVVVWRKPILQKPPSDTGAERIRGWLQHHQGGRCGGQSSGSHHRPHDDAHRPSRAGEAGFKGRIPDRLGLQHRRCKNDPGPRWLRVLR